MQRVISAVGVKRGLEWMEKLSGCGLVGLPQFILLLSYPTPLEKTQRRGNTETKGHGDEGTRRGHSEDSRQIVGDTESKRGQREEERTERGGEDTARK